MTKVGVNFLTRDEVFRALSLRYFAGHFVSFFSMFLKTDVVVFCSFLYTVFFFAPWQNHSPDVIQFIFGFFVISSDFTIYDYVDHK